MASKPAKNTRDLEVLAGEYVLGVGNVEDRAAFEEMCARQEAAAEARLRWENRLAALNDDYLDVEPPASIKSRIDQRLFGTAAKSAAATGGWWNSVPLWRGIGLAGSAAAIGLAVYAAGLRSDLDRNRGELSAAIGELNEIENTLSVFETELASRGSRLNELEGELAASLEKQQLADSALTTALAELEEARSSEAPLLVVSLESGETDYRFLAVHEEGSDKVRMTLVSGAVEPEKDFELWLVEPQSDTVSLGVISPGKSAVELSPEHVRILESGGLLAVSVEQKGGSPTGTAEGPVVAVGAPNEL